MDETLLARLRELCADPVDPSAGMGSFEGAPRARRGRGRSRAPDHKLHQLCGAVCRAVDLALGASGDPLLHACWVQDVSPAPDAGRLRVRVATLDGIDVPAFQETLRRATPWLRSEVAQAIQRKKAPTLLVEWAGPLGG